MSNQQKRKLLPGRKLIPISAETRAKGEAFVAALMAEVEAQPAVSGRNRYKFLLGHFYLLIIKHCLRKSGSKLQVHLATGICRDRVRAMLAADPAATCCLFHENGGDPQDLCRHPA